MPAPIVVLDLDGTLVDTAPDLADTLNVVLAGEGLPPVPFALARNMIGGGARQMLERGLALAEHPVCAADLDRMFGVFLEHYAAHIADRSRPFPGAEQALIRLIENDFVLAICTNKLEWLARKLLDTLGLSRHFALVCGGDTFGVKKPDPEVWRKTILQAGADPKRGIMVGDSVTDVEFARAAGVPIVGVDFGYTDVPVSEFGPDRIIGHFDQLREAVSALMPQVR